MFKYLYTSFPVQQYFSIRTYDKVITYGGGETRWIIRKLINKTLPNNIDMILLLTILNCIIRRVRQLSLLLLLFFFNHP